MYLLLRFLSCSPTQRHPKWLTNKTATTIKVFKYDASTFTRQCPKKNERRKALGNWTKKGLFVRWLKCMHWSVCGSRFMRQNSFHYFLLSCKIFHTQSTPECMGYLIHLSESHKLTCTDLLTTMKLVRQPVARRVPCSANICKALHQANKYYACIHTSLIASSKVSIAGRLLPTWKTSSCNRWPGISREIAFLACQGPHFWLCFSILPHDLTSSSLTLICRRTNMYLPSRLRIGSLSFLLLLTTSKNSPSPQLIQFN